MRLRLTLTLLSLGLGGFAIVDPATADLITFTTDTAIVGDDSTYDHLSIIHPQT